MVLYNYIFAFLCRFKHIFKVNALLSLFHIFCWMLFQPIKNLVQNCDLQNDMKTSFTFTLSGMHKQQINMFVLELYT